MRDSKRDDVAKHIVSTTQTNPVHVFVRIQNGDEQALNEIVHQYATIMMDFVTPILGSRDLAQDVVQDVFCWLWDNRAQLSIADNVLGYLCRAAKNRAYNILRQERSQGRLKNEVLATYASRTLAARNLGEATIAESELQSAIDTALSTLQARTRQIFLMHIDGQLTYAEIAEALGVTVPTVRMQMYRATKQLWEQLEEYL